MSDRIVSVIRQDFAHRPALDTAVSRAIMLEVGEGTRMETLRIHQPARVVAFGRQDVISDGYHQAVKAAVQYGFAAIERLAGGRAAVFHEGTIAFAWAIPDSDPKTTITDRFQEISSIVRESLVSLGVDAGVGEVPGEYCPGAYSVHGRGRQKLMGVGQRLTRASAHVGGVIVVDDPDSIRDVLIPVYEALRLSWDPDTVGSVNREKTGIGFENVVESLLAEFASRFQLIDGSVGADTLERATRLEIEHLPTK